MASPRSPRQSSLLLGPMFLPTFLIIVCCMIDVESSVLPVAHLANIPLSNHSLPLGRYHTANGNSTIGNYQEFPGISDKLAFVWTRPARRKISHFSSLPSSLFSLFHAITKRPQSESDSKEWAKAKTSKQEYKAVIQHSMNSSRVPTDTTIPVLPKVPTTFNGPTHETNAPATTKPRKTMIWLAFLSSLSGMIFASKLGIVQGPYDTVTGTFGAYTDSLILRDVLSTFFIAMLANILVNLIATGYARGLYSANVSRKLSHVLSAPLFVLFFPIFSNANGARYFAAIVCLVNALRLYLAATTTTTTTVTNTSNNSIGMDQSLMSKRLKEEENEYTLLARSVSRSGNQKEALGGPFIYVCLLSAMILIYWRTNVVGIVATMIMSVGDGMADVIGRQWGSNNQWQTLCSPLFGRKTDSTFSRPVPPTGASWQITTPQSSHQRGKSIVGTLSFIISATVSSYGMIQWLQYTGCLEGPTMTSDLLLRIFEISVACAIVELVPMGDDNLTVPLCAALVGTLLIKGES